MNFDYCVMSIVLLSEGCVFHEEQVRTDPVDLQWLLREDYRDYRLPEGWKSIWELRAISQELGGGFYYG
jgi:hypothetical protein